MFGIYPDGRIEPHAAAVTTIDQSRGAFPVWNREMLAAIIDGAPGAHAVRIWNQLSGVQPINTPKFRNRETAVERIWNKLAELYPDAILPEDMPKKKQRGGYARKTQKAGAVANRRSASLRKVSGRPLGNRSPAGRSNKTATNGGRKSAWASELTAELKKRFNPGQEFGIGLAGSAIYVAARRGKEVYLPSDTPMVVRMDNTVTVPSFLAAGGGTSGGQ